MRRLTSWWTSSAGGLAVVKAHRIQAVLRVLTAADGRVRLPDLRRMRQTNRSNRQQAPSELL